MDGMVKESYIYGLLESYRTFWKRNDLRGLTNILKSEMRACRSKAIVLLGQYRMSLDVATCPLTSFTSREFVDAIADAMQSKTSFADFFYVINPLLTQRINMPTSMLMFFIATLARVTS